MSALPEAVTQPLPPPIVAKMPVLEDGEYSILFDTAKFEQAYRVARLFSSSKFVPEAYQGQPENCFVALQMATRLHIDPLMFMQKTYIVHNKPGMEATLAIALVNARGPFTGPIQWRMEGAGMGRKCTAYATHRQTNEVCEAECSMDMAKAEGWYDKSGSKWKTLPDLMLRYRSAAFLCRLYAPECLMGIPTVDELQDVGPGAEIDVTPKTQPERRSASALLREVATKPPVDKATGEIQDEQDNALRAGTERPAAGGNGNEPPGNAPTFEDAIALLKQGDIDAARDICPADHREQLEATIQSRENARAHQEHQPGQRPSRRAARTAGTAAIE